MFYYSINSKEKIVHYDGCHHLKKIKEKNLKAFDNAKDFRNCEYKICSCCSPITKLLKHEETKLSAFCQEYGISYFLHKGQLYIRTPRSKWKVLVTGNKETLELHHKNIFKKEHDNSVPGYHRQNYTSTSIMGFMNYIAEHEQYRKRNPITISAKEEPLIKGTKRWNKQQKIIKKKERKRAIRNVISLLDNLACV